MRHGSIKEVEDQGGGRDVHDRGQHPFIDGDVVLLFAIVLRRGMSLSEFEWRLGTAGIEKREMAQRIVEVGGKKPESAHQQNDQDNPAQSHGLQTLKTFLIQIRRLRAKVPPRMALPPASIVETSYRENCCSGI
jgi:hypothetical protein